MTYNRRERGSGSISQRKDGTWTARVTVGFNANGKRKVKALYGKTESEVRKKMKEYIKELAKNDGITIQKYTVEIFMLNWLRQTKMNELKPISYDRLEQTILTHIVPRIGLIQVASLTADDIQQMLNKIRDEGFKYSTIKKVYNALTDCFRTAVEKRQLPYNPTLGVTIPRKDVFDEGEIKCYTQEEAKALCEAAMAVHGNGAPKYRLGACIPILLNTGIRAGELAGLRWSDVNFEKKEIRVHSTRTVVRDRGGKRRYKTITQNTTKTKSGTRTIALNGRAIEAFEKLRQITGDAEFVYSNAKGEPMSYGYIGSLVNRVAVAAGLPEDRRFSPHALRHTFASLLFENKVPIETISKLMGHSSIQVTQNIYVHIFNIEQKQQEAVSTLDNIF